MSHNFFANQPDPEQEAIRQQLLYARALQQQSLQPDQGQMVSGHYVAPSWTQGLARLGEAALGGYSRADALKTSKALADKEQQSMIDALKTGDPSALMRSPRTAPLGAQLFLKNKTEADRQKLIAQFFPGGTAATPIAARSPITSGAPTVPGTLPLIGQPSAVGQPPASGLPAPAGYDQNRFNAMVATADPALIKIAQAERAGAQVPAGLAAQVEEKKREFETKQHGLSAYQQADLAVAGGNLGVARGRLNQEILNQGYMPTATGATPIPGGPKDPKTIENIARAQTSGKYGVFDPSNGADITTTGPAVLDTLTPGDASLVKAYGEGRQLLPRGFAARDPHNKFLMDALARAYPEFDFANPLTRVKTRNSFLSGPDSETSKSINTTISHIVDLKKAYDQLNNSRFPFYNTMANQAGVWGGNTTVQANVADLKTRALAVSHELAKVFRQTGMSEQDIKSWQDQLDLNAAPATSGSSIKSALGLLQGRIDAHQQKYTQGMGLSDSNLEILSPKAKAQLEWLEGGGEKPTNAPIAPPPDQSAMPMRLKFDAQGNPL